MVNAQELCFISDGRTELQMDVRTDKVISSGLASRLESGGEEAGPGYDKCVVWLFGTTAHASVICIRRGVQGGMFFFAAPIHLHALAPLGVAPRSQPPAVICRWGALISDNLIFLSAAQGKLHDAHVERKKINGALLNKGSICCRCCDRCKGLMG